MTREEAIQVLANFYVSNKNPKANHFCEALYIAIQALKNEPKHGKWIKCANVYSDGDYQCSECHKREWSDTDYCPNCGAKMDEVEE